MNKLFNGDCRQVMAGFSYRTFDSIVCDPPYGLEFMGKDWDAGVPGVAYWKEALRVLKPGGYLLAFGGTRTYHRMACAIEDAGFELRDCIMWIYGSGFPKSQDVSKAIDKAAGAKRPVTGVKPGHEEFANRATRGHLDFKDGSEGFDRPWMHDDEKRENYHVATGPATENAKKWDGWGTALKPAYEPIILARKPLEEKRTVASNVVRYGTGALNIDAGRIQYQDEADKASATPQGACTAKSGSLAGKTEYLGCNDYAPDTLNPAEDDQDICTSCFYRVADHKPRKEFERPEQKGRWPANIIHDGSDEVLQTFPDAPGQIAESIEDGEPQNNSIYGKMNRGGPHHTPREEQNKSAARFFYCPKASRKERESGLDHLEAKPFGMSNQAKAEVKRGATSFENSEIGVNSVKMVRNNHPTVKPIALMRYLCKLVTQPNGTILDPFMGSGTTGIAALEEGFNFYGIELDKNYYRIAESRINGVPPENDIIEVISAPCEFD